MKKKLIIFILALTVAVAFWVSKRFNVVQKIVESVKKPLLVTSLANIEQYYGKKIRVEGKTGPLFAKMDFINLTSGDRLALCCGFETELHQQWVEVTGVLEPPVALNPNLPVAGQITETMLYIKHINKIELQDEERYCESVSDCVVVAEPEKENPCCLGCTEEAINELAEKERKEWQALNCNDVRCPVYGCYSEKVATARCINNLCTIKWVERDTQ